MKKETKEHVITTKIDVWVSEDGQSFKTEEECRKYEESALFAVKSILIKSGKLIYLPTRYNEKTTGALYFGLESLFGGCSCDFNFYLFCPETEEDIKNFLQFVKLLIPGSINDLYKRTKENFHALSERLIVDDFDNWEKYRQFCGFTELEPGKTYIFHYMDDWGNIYETEKLKSSLTLIVDNIVKQFKKNS